MEAQGNQGHCSQGRVLAKSRRLQRSQWMLLPQGLRSSVLSTYWFIFIDCIFVEPRLDQADLELVATVLSQPPNC